MTNGEYFVLTHPNVKVEENGTCVWIYNLDNTDCNHHTMSMEWWNEEMADIRPNGDWITFKTNRLIMQCPECTAFLSRERTDIFKDKIGNVNYCPNCGARMED